MEHGERYSGPHSNFSRLAFIVALAAISTANPVKAYQIGEENDLSAESLSAVNLIENAGFEMGTAAPFLAGTLNGTLSLTTDPFRVHGGAYALAHLATGDDSYTSPWNGSNRLTYKDDTTFRLTAWVRAEAEDTRVRLFIFSLQNEQTNAQYWSGQSFFVGTGWQKIGITHYSPPGYDQVAIRLDNRDAGNLVFWDDLRLAPVANQAPNPGFEATGSAFTGAQNGTISIDGSQAHKGAYSLLHQASDNDSYTIPWRFKGASLGEVKEGEVYSFSVWARAGVNAPVQLRIFALDGTGEVVDSASGTFTATANWKNFSIEHLIPANAESVSIRLDNDGGAGSQVWWDDLILERLVPQKAPTVSFTAPVARSLKAGEAVFLETAHQRGREGWFSFEIPGEAVELQWIQTQGPIKVKLGAPSQTAFGFAFTGVVQYVGPEAEDFLSEQSKDFTAELQFLVDGETLTFLVNGSFAFVDWSMSIPGGSGFDIELDDFPSDHVFNLEIHNFSFDEELIIPVLDLFETVFQSPFGIDTIFIVTGVQDPQGIDPNGVVLVQPGGTEFIPITLSAGFSAESGNYDAFFQGFARNGFSESANLFGTFRREGDDLTIENISAQVRGGPSVPNNGSHSLPEPLQASGSSLIFDIYNFNTQSVFVEEPIITTISAPPGSNLEYVPDGPIAGIVGSGGDFAPLPGTLTYDEENAQDGNFIIDVTFEVRDIDGGFVFSEFYSFSIAGAIGSESPCPPGKRGDPICEGPLLVRLADNTPVVPDQANPLGGIRPEYLDGNQIAFELKIRNISEGVCVVTGMTVSGTGYGIPGGQFPFTLQPEQERTVEVVFTFQGLNPGPYAGEFVLSHDDGSTLAFTLTLDIQQVLGIRLRDDGNAEIKLSTFEEFLRDEFDFTPDGPMAKSETRRFQLFTILNQGTRPVLFKGNEITIAQNEVIGERAFEPVFPSGPNPTIPPGGSSGFGVELLSFPSEPEFAGTFQGTVNLPFEAVDTPPDPQNLFFGVRGDIGIPAELEIDVCPTGLICTAGTSQVLEAGETEEVGFGPSGSDKTFTLKNVGEQPLYITDIIVGGAAFNYVPPNPDEVAEGLALRDWEDDSFEIEFQPPPGSDDGETFNGTVTITFDPQHHPGMQDFFFFLTGQSGDVEVQSGGFLLPQGGNIDFHNNTQAGGGTVREMVFVENFGTSPLSGTVALTSIQGNGFSLDPGGTFLNIQVPGGGFQSFEVVLSRDNPGNFAAEVSLDHNIPGPDPYSFTVQGTIGGGQGGSGTYRVTHGATQVEHNGTFSFGQTPVGVPVGKNFLIRNDGDEPLVLPRANFTVPAGYQLIETPNGPIPPPDPDGTVHSDNFSVHLTANQPGQFDGAIRFTNNSGHSPNPFTMNVEGSVGPQEPGPQGIRVTHGATEVPHLSLFSFGTTQEGTFIGKNFRIWNETNQPLTFPRANFSVPPGYQLIETPDGPIPPPDPSGTVYWDNFSVHLHANNPGTFNGQVSFVAVDAGGSPLPAYRINVTGNVTQDPICLTDTTAPNLTITEPADNAILEPGTVWIRATATDNQSGMERVRFLVDNELIKNDSSPPYETQWTATLGNHTIKAQAFDHCGNLRVRTISVTVEDPCAFDAQGPTAGITNPADGAELDPGLVNITVSAADPSGVDHVEFYINGNLERDDTEPPWTHGRWFTVQGEETITIIAYDGCGNPTSDTVTFTVLEDGAPCEGDDILPWGSISSPANGAVLNPGPVTLTATANDNVEVFAVSFEIDGQVPPEAVDLAPPYSYVWNATPGNHSIRIRILDVCDNLGYSSPISVNVTGGSSCGTDQTPPTVSITLPQEGAAMEPGLIDITVSANDNAGGSGMDYVAFFINGQLWDTDDAPPWTHGHWFTIEGQQVIEAVAYDQCGNHASDTVTFSITENGAPCDGDNEPPTGVVTNPTANSVIPPGPITLTGTADDNVSVLAVTFVVDGVALEGNVDFSPPYEYTWDAEPGVHTIHLAMIDVCDNTGNSPTITVTVDGSTPTTVPNFLGEIGGQNIDGLTVNQTNPVIDFYWDHASAASGIERYQIVVQPVGGPWLYQPHVLYPNTTHTIQASGLQPGTSYSIHIRAKSNDGIWGNFVLGGAFTVQ